MLTSRKRKLQGPINVTGWKFAFEVDFHKLDVPQGDEHDKVVKRLNQPGDYSIKRLFIDFSSKIRGSSTSEGKQATLN